MYVFFLTNVVTPVQNPTCSRLLSKNITKIYVNCNNEASSDIKGLTQVRELENRVLLKVYRPIKGQDRQDTNNVTLKSVCVTIFVVEKQ